MFNKFSIWSDWVNSVSSSKKNHKQFHSSFQFINEKITYPRSSPTVAVHVLFVKWTYTVNPPHHLQIQPYMHMFSTLRNETDNQNFKHCYFKTKLTFYFPSHLCIAGKYIMYSEQWNKYPRVFPSSLNDTAQLVRNQKIPGNVYAFFMFALCLLLEWFW